MNDDIVVMATEEPLWIRELRTQCEDKSQTQVAKEIGYTGAVVSAVLSNTYRGNIANVEKAVRGAYLGATVGCPVLGELQSNRCLEHQRAPFAATNHQRVRLYRACRNKCVNSQLKKEKKQ